MTPRHFITALLCGLILSGCGAESTQPAPEDLSGIWRLNSVEFFNGYRNLSDKSSPEQTFRLYCEDSLIYEVVTLIDDKGIVLVPENKIVYSNRLSADSGFIYIEGGNPLPLTRSGDSIMTIQNMGFVHTYMRHEDDGLLRDAILRAFGKGGKGGEGGYQLVSRAENKLKARNDTLLWITAVCAAIFIALAFYQFSVMRRKHRMKQKLRDISESSNMRPPQMQEALRNMEEDFLKSDYYIQLHRRIQRGERLSEADWREMEMQLKRAYPNFIPSLSSLINTSEVEFRTCMLIRLSVSPTNMAAVLYRDLSSISTIRSRLYRKVFGKKGSSREWDEFILSL